MKEIAITKKYYDDNYLHWVNNKTNSFYYEKQFEKLFKLWQPKDKIIDIGCAGAVMVPMFLGIGRHTKYFGMDISKSFIKIAQKRYPQLDFFTSDIANKNTLPKIKFSGFVASSILMHIPTTLWDDAFSNLESLVKKGGYGFISLPTEHPNKNFTENDTRHFSILDATSQKNYFKKLGWKIVMSGVSDGFTKSNIWHWYIVKLLT